MAKKSTKKKTGVRAISKKKKQEALLKRQQASKSKIIAGKSFFKSELGEDVKFWRCKEGKHEIDIIPYLAGDNDPDLDEGDVTYLLEVYAHKGIGADEVSIICPRKTYKKGKCAICEHRENLIAEGADEDLIDDLALSKNPTTVYNVWVHDSKEEESKGVQIWSVSRWFIEKHLQELSTRKTVEDGEEIETKIHYYDDGVDGRRVSFTKKGEFRNQEFLGHQFFERTKELPEDILDQAHALDQLVHVPSYEETFKALFGEDEEIDEDGSDSSSDEPDEEISDQEEDQQEEQETEQEDDPDEGDDPESCPDEEGNFGEDYNKLEACDNCPDETWDLCERKSKELTKKRRKKLKRRKK